MAAPPPAEARCSRPR